MSEILVFPGGGRRPAVDARDHGFPLGAVLGEVESERIYRHWTVGPILDQGRSSSCVGHAIHQLLRASPIRNTKGIPDPYRIYREAQLIDEWPGEDPEILGTSVRAGIKIIRKLGYVESYRWAFDGQTAVNHILNVSPVVIGVNWTEGMMSCDGRGFIYPRGRSVGGHCVLVSGANIQEKTPEGDRGTATIVNSWGGGWGRRGRAKISLKHLDELIQDNGEAVAVFETLKQLAA